MYTHERTKGYSLVEVMVAIAILMLSIAGPITIASKGLQSSYYARDQLTAFMLAQEGIEAITAIRNEAVIAGINSGNISTATIWDWVNNPSPPSFSNCFVTVNSEGCNIDFSDKTLTNNAVVCNTTSSNPCKMKFDVNATRARFNNSTGSVSPFTRVIKINETVNDQEVSVDVTVKWNPTIFGSVEQSITLSTSLFNIYGQ